MARYNGMKQPDKKTNIETDRWENSIRWTGTRLP